MNIRKTFGLLFCFLLWAQTNFLRAQTTGVGIYTENLQGVFHVDAAKNNPASGSVPPANQADDVVVSENGYMGIGTLAPSAKLHIHTRNQTGVFPLRLTDGSADDNGKMLTSDAEGVASWQASPAVPPSSAIYPVRLLFEGTTSQAFPLNSQTKVNNSDFTVPENGLYSVDVRFWGEGRTSATTSTTYTVTRFQLRKKVNNVDVVVDEYQHNESVYVIVTAFMTLYAEALQGEVLSVYVYPASGFANLSVNSNHHQDHIKSRLLYKKLGINDDTHYFIP